MKTKITITYTTDTKEESDDILTQIGLLLMKNEGKIKEYEVEFEEDIE